MRYVFLCDYGLDDAVATIFFLEHRNGNDAVDILAIGGNSDADVSLRNAHTLLASYEGDLRGVRIVNTCAKQQTCAHLPSIHGEDGIGDILPVKKSGACEITYAEWMTEREPIYVVSLGPCTLTAEILQRKSVAGLLIMAGNVCEEPNFNGYEFNHYLDKVAFARCVNHPLALVATLDTCRAARFNLARTRFEGDKLIDRLANRAIELARARHPDNCYIYDYIAVQYIFTPEIFSQIKVKDCDGNVFTMLKANS